MSDESSYSIQRDEVLELLWTERERSGCVHCSDLASLSVEADGSWDEITAEMSRAGLVRVEGETLVLTADGETLARQVVRRHRLAEVLFNQVFELPMEETERTACGIEHVLSAAATDAVCSFLGHPPTCPHGLPIAPGECCRRLRDPLRPLLRRLTDVSPGRSATIAFIAPRGAERLDSLTDLGLLPGTVIVVRQQSPAIVVEIDHTLLALDADVAQSILVREACAHT
jgi:DtxR family Mn-dependent transcriptional regulator